MFRGVPPKRLKQALSKSAWLAPRFSIYSTRRPLKKAGVSSTSWTYRLGQRREIYPRTGELLPFHLLLTQTHPSTQSSCLLEGGMAANSRRARVRQDDTAERSPHLGHCGHEICHLMAAYRHSRVVHSCRLSLGMEVLGCRSPSPPCITLHSPR
jgi:hypothetical protein